MLDARRGIDTRHSQLLTSILCASPYGPVRFGHAEQQMLINFDVPDETTFVETLRFERTVTHGSSPPGNTLIESRGHYTVRRTTDGYSVYVQPVKPLDMQASENTQALVAGAMTNMRLRYDRDAQGHLRNIAGIEQGIAEVENLLPEALRPVLGIAGLTPSNVERQLVLDWRARGLFYGTQLSGRSLPLGKERQVNNALYPSALAGLFRANGRLRTSGPVGCGQKQCVSLESIGESRDPTLGDALSQYARSTLVGTVKSPRISSLDINPTLLY